MRERVLARARVARLPGLSADEVQDEDVLDAEGLSELLLAAFQATLDDLREAVTTLEELEPIVRRVLGGAHPLTTIIEGDVRLMRLTLRARETPSPGSA